MADLAYRASRYNICIGWIYMKKFSENRSHGKFFLSNAPLFFSIFFITLYYIFLNFLSPALYDSDSYYHVAVSNLIKSYGLRYDFHWAQFSTFKYFFSDKDFLFHLLIIPFLYLSKNILWILPQFLRLFCSSCLLFL